MVRIFSYIYVSLVILWVPFVQAAESTETNNAEAMISRLSDAEVRELLIKQLSRSNNHAGQQAEEFNPAVILYRFQRGAGNLNQQLHAIFATLADLPEVFPTAWKNFTAEHGSVAWFFVMMLTSMGTGVLAAIVVATKLRKSLADLEQGCVDSIRAKARILGTHLLVRFICIITFAGIASAVFVAFFEAASQDRIAFFFYLAASVIFTTVIALSHAFHAPFESHLRLPHYSDADARSLHRTTLTTVGFGAFAYFTCALFGTLNVVGEVHELFLILVGTITTTLLIYTIISGRHAIANDICYRGAEKSPRRTFANMWPWVFAIFIAVLWVGLVVDELLTDFVPYGAALVTIGLMAVCPSIDALFFREELKHASAHNEVKQSLARGARIALTVVIVVGLTIAWGFNPLAMSESGGIGAFISKALLQISITLLVAYVIWQFTRIVIDQKIAEEDAQLLAQGIDPSETEIGGTGLSRMRTLLPLCKRTLQVTLLIIAIMISFSSLGVDIAPLLAGAGVLGLAIGFGSQTLVRDIVSGAFFLIDDAFRIGEYIDVGSVKGVVEKMSIRSLRLRHHRGAVHTVPFGGIKTLTNYSRDWAIMKLRFRVPFATNVDMVRKLLKVVGTELAENEAIKDDFIQPFKSQGATEADDYGFIITTKFMSKPGKQFTIRRFAFAAVQKAFAEHGIEFATPKVEVSVEDSDDGTLTRPSAPASASGAAAEVITKDNVALT